MKSKTSIAGLALLFLRLGVTGFGGPAAHIGLMRNEVVRRRSWLTDEEFLDLIGLTNLIPGPNSTEMAMHIGYRMAGYPGLIVSGISFILPAALIVGALAWAYVTYSRLPEVTHVMAGIKPVIIAIVLNALISLSGSALKNAFLKVLGVVLLICSALSVNEVLILLLGGIASELRGFFRQSGPALKFRSLIPAFLWAGGILLVAIAGSVALSAQTPSFSPPVLFLYFLKVGSILYGSGYVLLAFLRADLVLNWHWLTDSQLLDAIAIGQVTPGPVFTTATFIGYLLGEAPAAVAATVGIFLPAFLFVAISAPFVEKIRDSVLVGYFLDGVNVASLSLMAFVTYQLGRSAITSPVSAVEFVLCALALWRFKLNATWLIAAGAMVGLLV